MSGKRKKYTPEFREQGAVLDADERAELERLRRENAELRLDRAFLKKPRPSSSPNRTWDV